MDMDKVAPVVTIPNFMVAIVKIVGNNCNAHCDYCFYRSGNKGAQTMSLGLLKNIIGQYAAIFPRRAQFIWHGGEPLLAGLPFFEKIIEIQKDVFPKKAKIENCVQTNAILVNNRWASFFRKHRFSVSVSLDGDKISHDQFRKYRDGRGTFDDVLRGIHILRNHQIEPGVIQVITRSSAQRSKENFHFLADSLGLRSWSILHYCDTRKLNPLRKQSLSNKRWADFFKNYIDYWIKRGNEDLRIVDLDEFLCGIWNKVSSLCSLNGKCEEFFCIDWDGKAYPCDGYLSTNPKLAIGDLSSEGLDEILRGRAWREFLTSAKFAPEECLSCKWYRACHNGCVSYRKDGKYLFCDARKQIFIYLEKTIGFQEKGGDMR